MGQYYRVVTLGDRFGIKEFFNPWTFDSGMKLMEHSYLGNKLVNTVLARLWRNPARVAWIGDYSDSEEVFKESLYASKLDYGKFVEIYGNVWNERPPRKLVKKGVFSVPLMEPEDYIGWYLVNHSRKSFVDFCNIGPTDDVGYTVNPLPLLTACGNGQGGGDYWEGYRDADKCGLWAFDMIEFSTTLPANYTEEVYRFCECEKER